MMGRPRGARNIVRTKPRRLTRVRCLGPGREHEFLSPDPVRCRVCDECRRKQRAMNSGWMVPCVPVPNLEDLK
jgi:hypothetical protein